MNVFLSALINGLVLSLPLTAAAWLALRVIPRTSLNAATRYIVWWAVLLVVIFLPFLYLPTRAMQTATRTMPVAAPLVTRTVVTRTVSGAPVSEEQPATIAPPSKNTSVFPLGVSDSRWASVILGIWGIGAFLMLTRLIASWIVLERRKVRAMPPPEHLLHRAERWLEQCNTTRRASLRVGPDAISGPIAIGPWRPSILFPAWVLNEFSDSEINQIGLHEAAHLARRDDYALTLQRILEALFCLHPVVRWITRQIDLEREIACDDFVVQSLGIPRVYATCLTRVAELTGDASPALMSAAVTDERSHLATRINMLLDKTRHTGTRLLKLRLSAGLAGVIVLAGIGSELPVLFSPVLVMGTMPMKATAQGVSSPAPAVVTASPAAKAAPDVPAVRPAPSTTNNGDLLLTLAPSPRFASATMTQVDFKPIINGVGGPKSNESPGSIDYQQVGLTTLMRKAWPMPYYQYVWPAWMVDSRSGNVNRWYDVAATMPTDTTPEQLQIMWQGLLVDRLKLMAHWETRNLNVYALKIAGGGVKFQKSANPAPPGFFVGGMGKDGLRVYSKGLMQPATAPSGTTLAAFVEQMNSRLDNPIVDMTGLEGVYDIDLLVPRDPGAQWPVQPLSGPGPYTKAQRNANWGFSQAALFSAMEAQLGLIVEPQTMAVMHLVIDSMNPVPTN